MKRQFTSTGIAARIWSITAIMFGFGFLAYSIVIGDFGLAIFFLPAMLIALLGSLPVFIIFLFLIPVIHKNFKTIQARIKAFLLFCFCCCAGYGTIVGIFQLTTRHDNLNQCLLYAAITTLLLFGCFLIAFFLAKTPIYRYFNSNEQEQLEATQQNVNTQTNINMETTNQDQPIMSWENKHENTGINKVLLKAIVTAVLILSMLVPTLFVSNLVTEREQRQKEVVKEVTSKWAAQQSITNPYIYLPYTVQEAGTDGKEVLAEKYVLLLPENLSVNSKIVPEQRPRSIYKVLLYKSSITASGDVTIQLPKDVNPASVRFDDAKICMGLSDFKGIDEKVSIQFGDSTYELTPGLPTNDIDSAGLSAPIKLNNASIGSNLKFSVSLKVKGSEQLSFAPLAGNSNFSVQSNWSSPSFDGSMLPSERTVNDSGFTAKWTFNKASLPFGTTLKTFNYNRSNYSFGVSMVQPADQYAKTSRSVKYAILIIGLTFSLFFIIELMQKKAVHPVQYVLVGLALVIFYTLLLSVSEFILFDYAYLIAAAATTLLIMLYAKSHFGNWKTASVFGGLLGLLYAFIFILIRLEDTALLVGSIGLFIVLAIVMYATRKINWYNPSLAKEPNTI